MYKIKDGFIDDLQIADNTRVLFKENNDSYYIEYLSKKFQPDEVLHFVLNPDDEYRFKGQGYTMLIKDSIENLHKRNKDGFLKIKNGNRL